MEIATSALKAVVEPLIDLIHGDVVLGDVCCRRVADALVGCHEMTLRSLVLSRTLPSGLEGAIETYCVRSYLMNAPALITQSHEVARMLERLADTLIEVAESANTEQARESVCVHPETDVARQTPFSSATAVDAGAAAQILAASGATIKATVAVLQAQPEPQCLARLVTALGEVVIGYILCAAQQCAQQAHEYLDGASWSGTRVAHASYHAALHQFSKSALDHSDLRRRKAVAAQEAEVQALLFGSDSDAAVEDGWTHARTFPPRASGTAPDAPFAAQVRAAMESRPSSPSPPQMHDHHHHEHQQQQQQQRQLPLLEHTNPPSGSTSTRRVLRSADDSVLAQYTALVGATPPADSPTPPPPGHRHSGALRDAVPAHDTMVDLNSPMTGDDSGAAQLPRRKVRRVDTVLIGASETSVLRLMEHTSDRDDRDDGLLGALATPPPLPSLSSPELTLLPSGVQQPHGSDLATSGRTADAGPVVVEGDAWEMVRRCLRRPDAEARSYFLCGATQRFEPSVTRGFF
ncbi:hypothetical protein NESM_000374700 [Novymonas esmeraldas]|uniref:Uncharacterized protein n=1 Tax=Novymonas esmeraldas TaxID=1808958 RepID=A0AAW0EMF0_9TRYP